MRKFLAKTFDNLTMWESLAFETAILFSMPVIRRPTSELPKNQIVREITGGTADNFDLILAVRGADYLKSIEENIKSSEIAGLGVYDLQQERYLYVCWIQFGAVYDKSHRKTINLAPSECYFFDATCGLDYRKRGLHTQMMQHRLNYVAGNAYRTAYISIYKSNIGAMRLRKKFCYRFEISTRHWRVMHHLKRLLKRSAKSLAVS